LCGKEHGFMPIVVEVMEPAKYAAWVSAQKEKMQKVALADAPGKAWTLDELKARGEKVYGQHCVACHQPTGMGTPPVFPALSGSKVVTGPKAGQIDTVLNGIVKDGKPTPMAAFKQQLSDVEIAAVITYTRNSWSNKTGEAVMPDEIKALRK
jgi:cytochrome c oxidase subunit 2